uniref:BTD domain-containing protein n=1 Tax=Macrostomum lignano TaxID=282301 RepID=A0A1I8FKM8_9PLAT
YQKQHQQLLVLDPLDLCLATVKLVSTRSACSRVLTGQIIISPQHPPQHQASCRKVLLNTMAESIAYFKSSAGWWPLLRTRRNRTASHPRLDAPLPCTAGQHGLHPALVLHAKLPPESLTATKEAASSVAPPCIYLFGRRLAAKRSCSGRQRDDFSVAQSSGDSRSAPSWASARPSSDMDLGTFLSPEDKPSKKKQSLKNSTDLCMSQRSRVALFNRLRLPDRQHSLPARRQLPRLQHRAGARSPVPLLRTWDNDEVESEEFNVRDGYIQTMVAVPRVKLVCTVTRRWLCPGFVVRKVDKACASTSRIRQDVLVPVAGQELSSSRPRRIPRTRYDASRSATRAAWTIISTDCAEYRWAEGTGRRRRPLRRLPWSTDLRLNGGGDMAMLEVCGENFQPNLRVWFGEIEAETMYRCEELLLCIVPHETLQVPVSLVRWDGVIFPTGLTFTYTPEKGHPDSNTRRSGCAVCASSAASASVGFALILRASSHHITCSSRLTSIIGKFYLGNFHIGWAQSRQSEPACWTQPEHGLKPGQDSGAPAVYYRFVEIVNCTEADYRYQSNALHNRRWNTAQQAPVLCGAAIERELSSELARLLRYLAVSGGHSREFYLALAYLHPPAWALRVSLVMAHNWLMLLIALSRVIKIYAPLRSAARAGRLRVQLADGAARGAVRSGRELRAASNGQGTPRPDECAEQREADRLTELCSCSPTLYIAAELPQAQQYPKLTRCTVVHSSSCSLVQRLPQRLEQ